MLFCGSAIVSRSVKGFASRQKTPTLDRPAGRFMAAEKRYIQTGEKKMNTEKIRRSTTEIERYCSRVYLVLNTLDNDKTRNPRLLDLAEEITIYTDEMLQHIRQVKAELPPW